MEYNPLNYIFAVGVISALESRLISGATIKHLAEVKGEDEFYRLISEKKTFYHSIGGGGRFLSDEKFDNYQFNFTQKIISKYLVDEPIREVFLGLKKLDSFRREIKTYLRDLYMGDKNLQPAVGKNFVMLPPPFGAISSKIFLLKKPPTPRQVDYIILSDYYSWAVDKTLDYPIANDYIRLLIDLANLSMTCERIFLPLSKNVDMELVDGGFIDKGKFVQEISKFSSQIRSSAQVEYKQAEKSGMNIRIDEVFDSIFKMMKIYARGYTISSEILNYTREFLYEEPLIILGRIIDDIKISFWRTYRLKEPFGFHLITGYLEALDNEVKNLRIILSAISSENETSPERIKQYLRSSYLIV